MEQFNQIIFGKKTFSNILEEIYTNQKKKQTQLNSLIDELKPLITDIGDATLIIPLLKEYLEIGVKNDEQLVKLAAIIQKVLQRNTTNEGDGFSITEEEKAQILREIDSIKEK